ncbi:MAG: DUF928 domain-containing protein [Nostoc sp. TH1S01]|nr:DUF928 domain-containing protein [Nostoc sp. TH1S01]
MKKLFKSMICVLPNALIWCGVIQNSAFLKAEPPKPVTSQQSTPPATQPTSDKKNQSRPVFRWAKTPGNLSTIPGRHTGMASRDVCPDVELPLRALIPFKQRDLTNQLSKESSSASPLDVWGLTTNEHPTFWYYVPYTKDIAGASAEFVLQESEDEEKTVYQSSIPLPVKPGIVKVTLPTTTMPLQIGKNYRWFFKVSCSGKQSVPIYVEGDIQRVNLNTNLAKQIASAKPREQVSIYADNGIWFDAVNLLVQLRQANPNDVALVSDWDSLLESVQIEKNYLKAPLVD